jgi:hypothetical protein
LKVAPLPPIAALLAGLLAARPALKNFPTASIP